MSRIFVSKAKVLQKKNAFCVALSCDVFRHLKSVLRVRAGESIEVVVDATEYFEVKVTELEKNELIGIIVHREQIVFSDTELWLAQSLPKQGKMGDILRRCTELGVDRFFPVITQRSDVKADETKLSNKRNRWISIISSAAEQSKQYRIPKLEQKTDFKEFITLSDSLNCRKIVFWEDEKKKTLKSFLKGINLDNTPILVFVGPEGGLCYDEVEQLKQHGFESVSLGKTILRVENAAFSGISNIFYELSC